MIINPFQGAVKRHREQLCTRVRPLLNTEAEPCPVKDCKDMFGVEWVYVPVADGCMVEAGHPLPEDVNDWEKKVIFPDISKWD